MKTGKRWKCVAAAVLAAVMLLVGCTDEAGQKKPGELLQEAPEEKGPSNVYYEVFVRAFADSDGDGIGDLNGLIDKLDYLNDGDPQTTDDLGVSGIWLMPINPSPSYHGYDVTDYYDIHPEYGTLDDFRRLVEEAQRRGISIVMDLIVNHTSDQHPWFTDSATGVDSPYRDWYAWRDDAPSGLSAASGGQAWHRKGDASYLGIFWGGMPDLNFDNAEVRAEMIEIGKFWLEQGVAGFRLDAAKHIYEDFSNDSKNPELEAKNLAWWEEFRSAMQEVKPDVYLVGEIFTNSVARVAPYFTVFDAAFNFAAGELIVSAANSGVDNNLASSLSRTLEAYERLSGQEVMDAPFLTNHDQNRVMSTLRGNVDAAKMAAAMLMTLPGRPYMYYGEEIGLQGVKPDEEIREPMKWVDDPADDPSQTSWRTPRHQRTTPSVAVQAADPDSLLNHYRQVIRWRSYWPVLVGGDLIPYRIEEEAVMAYERGNSDERVLVVHNLGAEQVSVTLGVLSDGTAVEQLLDGTDAAASLTEGELTLPPHSSVLLH